MPRAINPLENVFYVYVLMDERKPGPHYYGHWKFDYEPFYVGKGKRDRYKHHLTNTPYWQGSGHKGRKVRKIQREGYNVEVRLVKVNLNEVDAFGLEVKLIAKIGRSDLKLGPLTNLTDGGDGLAGQRVTAKTKKKLSKSVSEYAESNKDLVRERAVRASATKSAKSEEEKAATRAKQSEAAKSRPKRTKAEKKAIVEKRIQTIKNKSEEEQHSRSEKFRKTLAARTPEQKALTAQKKLDAWYAKSDKEKKRIINARRLRWSSKTEQEKKEFSEKMSKVNKKRYESWTPEQKAAQAVKISIGRNKNK